MRILRALVRDGVVQLALAAHVVALVILALAESDPVGPAAKVLTYVEPLLLAIVLFSLISGRRRFERKRERRFWDLLALAWACWLLVEVFYFFELTIPFLSASFVADILYVFFYLFFALALELKVHLRLRPSLQLFRRRLESTAGLVAVFGLLVYFALVVAPEPLGLSLSFVARDQGLVPYLLMRLSVDLFLLGRTVYATFTSSGRWPHLYGLLAAALAAYSMRDAVLVLQVENILQAPPMLLWTGFLYLPGFLVVLAARYRRIALPAENGRLEPSTVDPPDVMNISFLGIYMLVVPGLHFIFYPLGLLEEASRGVREVFCLLYLVSIGVIAVIHQKATETDRNRAIESLQKEVAERNRVNRELQLRQAEMEQFTYTISHELKAPLVTMHGFLDLLERDVESADDESARNDLGRIRTAATSMSALLIELLKLSRTGWVVERKPGVSMNEVAEAARSKLAVDKRESACEIFIEEDLPMVDGDSARLEDVLINLITNAIKFTKVGEIPKVRIGCRHEKEPVFFVSDQGRGVDPRYHDRIFGLFDRVHPDVEGTGVGLALVKRIIEKHGGQVWVESEGVGHGATFCMTIPSSEPQAAERA